MASKQSAHIYVTAIVVVISCSHRHASCDMRLATAFTLSTLQAFLLIYLLMYLLTYVLILAERDYRPNQPRVTARRRSGSLTPYYATSSVTKFSTVNLPRHMSLYATSPAHSQLSTYKNPSLFTLIHRHHEPP